MSNPYSRLKDAVVDFRRRVLYPVKVEMWRYPRDKMDESWSMRDLDQRVRAADQLGYDVRLISRDDGLLVQYVKRCGDLDYFLG